MNESEIGSLLYRAPSGLRAGIAEQVRAADRSVRRPSLRARPLLRGAALAVAWAASLVVVSRLAAVPSGADQLVQEVVSSHVRSMMAAHLTDVESSDRHTVKPWFGGKLDFSPKVVDAAADGFPLVGGRLEYLAGRPVAALVYRRQQHVINLFTWPSAQQSEHAPRLAVRQGYQIFEWDQGQMQYWLVSDLNATELQALADLLRQ